MLPDSRIPLGDVAAASAAPLSLAITPQATRADFLARVGAWRSAFAAAPGNAHALHLDDGFEFAAALFGGWQAGKTLWLPCDILPATLDRLRNQVDGWAGELPDALQVTDAAGSTADVGSLDPDACRLVLFTSGSTGEPSAIAKTLRQLDNEVDALESQFGTLLGDALVHGTVSHQHIYGLLFRLLWPLSARRRFAPQRLAYNEELTVLGREPLVLIASPAHLKRLPDNQDWRPLAEHLRVVFSSGGPLPADAAHDVQRLWRQPAIEVFGSTETGGIAWRRSGGAAPAWQALPGVRWRLADGLLELQSPHLHDSAWYRTQDRAVAAAGGFELRGRADRILKLEERRISLSALERRLRASPLLDDVRVIALPGHRILVAVVAVPSEHGREQLEQSGKNALTAELRDWLTGHVDPIASPRRWRFLDALPVDPQGKTSERRLAELFRPLMPEPEWRERSATHASLVLDVTAELAAFEGHFPQAAVLPGVALLDWAVRLGRDAFGVQGGLLRMETVKFQHLVRPGAKLQVDLDWQPAVAQLGFRFVSGQGVHASGRLRFPPPESGT